MISNIYSGNEKKSPVSSDLKPPLVEVPLMIISNKSLQLGSNPWPLVPSLAWDWVGHKQWPSGLRHHLFRTTVFKSRSRWFEPCCCQKIFIDNYSENFSINKWRDPTFPLLRIHFKCMTVSKNIHMSMNQKEFSIVFWIGYAKVEKISKVSLASIPSPSPGMETRLSS